MNNNTEDNKALITAILDMQQRIETLREENSQSTLALQQQQQQLAQMLQDCDIQIRSIKQSGDHDIMALKQEYVKNQHEFLDQLSTLRKEWATTLPANQQHN